MKDFPVLDAVATGARIKELRKQNKLTVEAMRDFLGLESTQAIYKWQRGESLPSIDNLYALSTLFNTSVDSILRGSREEDQRSSSFDFRDIFDFDDAFSKQDINGKLSIELVYKSMLILG